MEIWKDIKGFEGHYQVSNLGRVKSLKYKAPRIMNVGLLGRGYERVHLSKGNVNFYSQLIHRLVAEAFVENPLSLPQVNHKDGNKLNNNAENLEWVTSRENRTHFYANNPNKKCKLVGVMKSRYGKPFNARIRYDGKQLYLGSFDTELEAHNAYKEAMVKYGITNRVVTP